MKKFLYLVILNLFLFMNAYADPIVKHGIGVSNLQKDGWHLAKSTEAKFKVKLPGVFNDVTITKDSPIYMVSSMLEDGTAYIAVLAPNGSNPRMFGQYKKDLNSKNVKISNINGRKVILTENEVTGNNGVGVNYSMRLKSEKGLYLLMVSTPIKNKERAKNSLDKFYGSLEVN